MSKSLAVLLLLLFAIGCSKSADVPISETRCEKSERLTALAIGDPAPPLRLGGFVKGEPFSAFEPGRIYVVEFSATWCGPCRAAIPHLTELQKKYPNVTFLSVYVREDDPDAPAKFIEEMGDRIGYRVAVDEVPAGEDSDNGTMWQTWMKAAEIRGIPELFIIDGSGRIIEITDPRVLAEPLAKIVAGEWDVEAAVSRQRNRVLEALRDRQFRQRLEAILKPPPSEEMLKSLNALKVEFPKEKFEEEAYSIALEILCRFLQPDGPQDWAMDAAKEVIAFQEGHPPEYATGVLNSVAWSIVAPERPNLAGEPLLLIARDAARRADELSHETSAQIADTLARAWHLLGNTKLALQAQQRAVRLALAEPDPNSQLIAELRGRLNDYAAALGLDELDESAP